jgi:hypothetical protein
MPEYAALAALPCALPDGLILVFQHPVKPPWHETFFQMRQPVLIRRPA